MASPPLSVIPVQFARVNEFPLETNTQFETYVAAEAYALTGPSYPGQEIKVITTNPADPIRTYEIQRDKSLKLVVTSSTNVVDNFDSDSGDDALSAGRGKNLNIRIENLVSFDSMIPDETITKVWMPLIV